MIQATRRLPQSSSAATSLRASTRTSGSIPSAVDESGRPNSPIHGARTVLTQKGGEMDAFRDVAGPSNHWLGLAHLPRLRHDVRFAPAREHELPPHGYLPFGLG